MENNTNQIIAEAANDCAKLIPISFGVTPHDFKPIIKAAIEKATEQIRQERDDIERQAQTAYRLFKTEAAATPATVIGADSQETCDEFTYGKRRKPATASEELRKALEKISDDLLPAVPEQAMQWSPRVRKILGDIATVARSALAATPATASEQDAEQLARTFHETYERLAPAFNYETRKASAKPWAEVPDNNKKLMIAVCAEILSQRPTPATASEPRFAEGQYIEPRKPTNDFNG